MKIFGYTLTKDKKGPGAFQSIWFGGNRGRAAGPAPTDARNELTVPAREELMRSARFFDKRSGLARSISQDMALYSVGDGFRAQARSADPVWNKAAEEYFREWARRADITQRYSLTGLLHIISRTIDRDGEIFAIKTRSRYGKPAIQLVEAHRCHNGEDGDDKGFVDGIKFDAWGAPEFYRFEQDDGSMRDVPASAVCHIHDPESISAARIRPSLTHGLDRLMDEREILGANITGVKDQLRVARAIIAPTEAQTSAGPAFGDVMDNTGTVPTAQEVNAALGGGTAFLPTGSSVVNLTNNLPNATFSGFMDYLRREVTSGVLPFEFVQDSSKIGGAAVRLVVGKADRVFSHRQTVLIESLLDSVWGWVIADAISLGKLAAVSNFWKCAWVTPRRVTVDAGRDAKANRDDIIAGIKTLGDHYAENAMDFDEETERRAVEMRKILDAAEKYGVPPSMLWNPSPNSTPAAAPDPTPDPENNDAANGN